MVIFVAFVVLLWVQKAVESAVTATTVLLLFCCLSFFTE